MAHTEINAVFGRDFDVPEKGDPRTSPRPVDPARATGPIADALTYTADRLDLIEHKLGDLNGIIERLGHNLRPVLTGDGDAIGEPTRETTPEDPSAIDRRSTIARHITALGTRAENLGSIVSYIAAKLEQIDDNLELEGVLR